MRKQRQVSQKHIAESLGMSQSTVSLVLSGRRVVSEQTSQRVLRAAEKLKYRPNLLVRGIQTGKSRMIGVMMAPFDFFWSEILYGIHDVLAASDHVPITLWSVHRGPPSNNDQDLRAQELEQVHRLLDRRVDGAILWPRFAELFSEHVHEFSSRNLPVVTIDHRLPPKYSADYVGSDEMTGGRVVAEHLYVLGHRRLGHLAGPANKTWAKERRSAFEAAVSKLPGASVVTLDTPGGDDIDTLNAAREMIALHDRPTAIFAATDIMAKVAYQAAKEVDLRIPEDLSIVGFSDDGFAPDMSPPLTTVRQPGYDIGRRAAEIVLQRSSGDLNGRRIIEELPVNLIVRSSTRAHTCRTN